MGEASRSNQFNSCDLRDYHENDSKSNLTSLIFQLQRYFPSETKDFSEVDKMLEDYMIPDQSDFPSDIHLYNETFVNNVRKDIKCLEIMKSLRSLMEDVKIKEEENWDRLVKKGFKVVEYHFFIYTLMKLIEISAQDKVNRDLSYTAGRTFIMLLALPGAKRCNVMNENLITAFFKLFRSTPLGIYDDHYFEIQIIQMLDECKNVFNVVCLSDQREVLEKYIEMLSWMLEHFIISLKYSTPEGIAKCFESLEALCLKPLPDKEVEEIMYQIFCSTVDLHFISQKRCRILARSKYGETISDFFLYLLSTYSAKTKNMLTKFIKSLLSNCDHKFERENFQKLVDVAVKYELAIYLLSHEDSIVDYLEKLALASDHRQRLHGVEFCGKMLLLESASQQPFQNDIPREAFIIKLLFEKINDKQDNVRLKVN